ncbi:MAG: T9SS type A sorting domain-containing protein [Saprospiraceae bacterium]
MKYITLFFLLISTWSFSQIPQDFEIEIEPITISDAPGIHSFSLGIDSLGRWLVIGGRVDGLHQRQPFAAFLANDNNTNAFVIDPENEQVWSTSLSSLPTSFFEQLQSTNQQFFQRGNQLYVIGGYGYSPTVDDHITYSYLTAIDVNGATNAIINGESITTFFRQISHPKMAVTGGYVGYLDSVFYLAGGQYFEGRYNPMGPNHGPGFIQEYTDAIRKFKVEDNGINLSIVDFSEEVDADNLHRRDYNMVPQFFPNGDQGFTMFSGVFQHDVDLPFLNSVDVFPSGYIVNNNFNQYLSQYHSARLPIFDEENNTMHTVFFGGMSQFTLSANGNLVEDENVPFVKTISRVTRFSDGAMEEVKLDIEMPTLVGSGAEFIPHLGASFLSSEILDLNDINQQKTLVGYIYGGIQSTQGNIFFINDGTQSFASNVIFKVFVKKITTNTKDLKVKDDNVFKISIYPNPTDSQVVIEYFNPNKDKVKMELFDGSGKIIKTIYEGVISAGSQKVLLEMPDLADGMYFISVENKKYKNVKTIFIE